MFQTDGEEDCFQWPGMRHINPGTGMHFGPVEKAIKRLLVFFAQTLAKPVPPSMFLFQDTQPGSFLDGWPDQAASSPIPVSVNAG